MNYQEKFEISSRNSGYFSKQFDILITGNCEQGNDRHGYMRRQLNAFKGIVVILDTCENSQKLSYDIENELGIKLETKRQLSLIPDLETLLRSKNFEGGRICIDITSLKQGILFLLIKILLTSVKPSRLFATYTEPVNYLKRPSKAVGLYSIEEYDLYDKIIGSSNPVPGFSKTQSQREKLLISPIGFDSQRLQTIYESLKPKRIIPVVGFPSFVPGWNQTAIMMNYLILNSADCYDMVRTCEAASPFEIYSLLDEEYQRNHLNFDIYISPLGTRPHCLGCALFASKNKNSYLIYDFPVEKRFRSENVLKASIYNLSKFIS